MSKFATLTSHARVNVLEVLSGVRELLAEVEAYKALCVELRDTLQIVVVRECPRCKGSGEIVWVGDIARCPCHGKYYHTPSDNEIKDAKAVIAKANEVLK